MRELSVSRRTALRGAGAAGLIAASGLLIPTTASAASGRLVAIDQMSTGHFSAENCGPTCNVIALVAIGKPPAGYVASITGNAAPVMSMRVYCGLSPSRKTTVKSKPSQWGSNLADLKKGLAASPQKVPSRQVTFSAALDAAAAGRTVILNVNHLKLLGQRGTDYGHYVVARGRNSAGSILVSDPGRARSLGVKAYTRSRLTAAARGNSALIVG